MMDSTVAILEFEDLRFRLVHSTEPAERRSILLACHDREEAGFSANDVGAANTGMAAAGFGDSEIDCTNEYL